jgi:hypothetical protein
MSDIMLGEALREVCGPFKDFVAKLEGSDGTTIWLPAFKRFLRKENPWSVWRTIKLGSEFKSADDFRSALSKKGNQTGDWANDIMSTTEFVKAMEGVNPDEEFDLVVRTTAELIGEERDAIREEIYAGATRLGLEKCSAWMGPKVRLDYQSQPNGELLIIAMEPITASDGVLKLFRVERRDSGLWFLSLYDSPGSIWYPGFQWVFVQPRK